MSQSETMNDVIKQNANLNDDIKVKAKIIKFLKEDAESDKRNQESTKNDHNREATDTNLNSNDNDEDIEEIRDDRIKCDDCDFKTRVRKYMKSHQMKHEGQYQCQRGCSEKFKTFKMLDKHHKTEHIAKAAAVFECKRCKDNFESQQKLRQHNEVKQQEPQEMAGERITCDLCGKITFSALNS